MSEIPRYEIENLKKQLNVEFGQKGFFFKEFDEFSQYPTEPYRTETYGLAYVKSGQLFLTTGLTDHNIKAPALLSMGPNVIRKWTETFKDAKTDTIFFTKEFLVVDSAGIKILDNRPYYEHPDLHVFGLNDKDEQCISTLFDTLKQFITSQYTNRNKFVRQQIVLLNIMVEELHGRHTIEMSATTNSRVFQFKNLAANHIKKHRDVKWYADQMNMSSKNLSKIIKEELGKTASQFLHDLSIIEAKILLQNPDATASEIAYTLNFSDPSTFGKYFKKYSGTTPAIYKKNLNNDGLVAI